MLKAIVFSIGLGSGAFLGVKVRDSGFTQNFTKTYYGNKSNKIGLDPKELSEAYQKGILDSPGKLEKFGIINNLEDLEKVQEYIEEQRNQNNSLDKKENKIEKI